MSSVVPFKQPTLVSDVDEVDWDDDTVIPEYRETTKQAMAKLDELKIEYRVVNNGSQIKVGCVNYYPTRKTTMVDGQRKFTQTGFNFFLDVLKRHRLYNG